MEIAPIPAIRPATMATPAREAPDLTGVFAVEFRKQDQDETYTPSRKASRGLEDENDEESPEAEPTEAPNAASSSDSDATISFFA